MHLDADACYRAVKSRDRRFDGVFWTGVHTTGIYCRPSCPATTPKQANVSFYPSAAAAHLAGFRACRRCLPDATPGSPEWDLRADVASRAIRLIADGVVERDGVEGLATRLGYSTRQLNRLVTEQYGAGPLALARSRRAQTARILIETSTMSFADIAFAAGFSSIRQFNDTIAEVYAATPTQLRGRRGGASAPGSLDVRIAVREPFAGERLLAFLSARVVEGVEWAEETAYSRTMRLPHGPGTARVQLVDRPDGVVPVNLTLADARDLAPAMERLRRLVDADCDPVVVDEALSETTALRPSVRRTPGLRVPGHVDGVELTVRAILGQQISVERAAKLAAQLVGEFGEPLSDGRFLFPDAARLAELTPPDFPMPRARGAALIAVCAEVAEGRLHLDRSQDRDEVRQQLLALRGIGPWTAAYVAMRALGDPDVDMGSDLVVRRALESLGQPDTTVWRPWRSYAAMHLWAIS